MLEFPGDRPSPWNRGRLIVQLISFWWPSSSWHCAWCKRLKVKLGKIPSLYELKGQPRRLRHQKSMPCWFNPSKDGDLNSSLGTWDKLWRREYLQQSFEAWAGLSQEGREERTIWQRKTDNQGHGSAKVPAFWKEHPASCHSTDTYRGSSEYQALSIFWEQQWQQGPCSPGAYRPVGTQTLNNSQETKEDRSWTDAGRWGGHDQGLLQVSVQLVKMTFKLRPAWKSLRGHEKIQNRGFQEEGAATPKAWSLSTECKEG